MASLRFVAHVCLGLAATIQLAAALEAPMSDAQASALAKQALTSTDLAEQKVLLQRLNQHRFKALRTPEREDVLFAQGILEKRVGDPARAAFALMKLERFAPRSRYLPEAQAILGEHALEKGRYKEAESRLRKVLSADVPLETKRGAQECLLVSLVAQARAKEGLAIIEQLHPIGNNKPSERGMVAIVEVLAAVGKRTEAETAIQDYRNLYPQGAHAPRAELALGKLLGVANEPKLAAEAFQKVIVMAPASTQADEARLALATLITEGKLVATDTTQPLPDPDQLLAQVQKTATKGPSKGRFLLVKIRLHIRQHHWKEALDEIAQLRASQPDPEDASAAQGLRVIAFRAWTQQQLDARTLDPLIPLLDSEGVNSLDPTQRTSLVRVLTQQGLPTLAMKVAAFAPAQECQTLLAVTGTAISPEVYPNETLKLISQKTSNSETSLKRAQAFLVLGQWPDAARELAKTKPGPERVTLLLTYLRRPATKDLKLGQRLKEAETWLSKAPEKGRAREALAVHVADLRAQALDWQGALNLYPTDPAPEQKGWVTLMRATCLNHLQRKAEARLLLKSNVDVPGFQMERQTLAKDLGIR